MHFYVGRCGLVRQLGNFPGAGHGVPLRSQTSSCQCEWKVAAYALLRRSVLTRNKLCPSVRCRELFVGVAACRARMILAWARPLQCTGFQAFVGHPELITGGSLRQSAIFVPDSFDVVKVKTIEPHLLRNATENPPVRFGGGGRLGKRYVARDAPFADGHRPRFF